MAWEPGERSYESIDIGFDQKEAGKRGLTPKVFDQQEPTRKE